MNIRNQAGALRGAQVHIRPATVNDVGETYLAWLNDPLVSRFLETRHRPQTLETIREFVEGVSQRADEHLFAICLNDNERHVGNIKVGPIKANHSLADVSLFIGARDVWGRGIATESIELISRFAICKLGISKLNAVAYAANTGSINAFLRAGYTREGVRRNHYLLDGVPADLIELGLCADDPVTEKWQK